MMRQIYKAGFTIQQLATTRNNIGGVVENWSTKTIIDGYLRDLSGDERSLANRNTVIATHRFYCDPVDVTEKDRLVYEDDEYDILYVSQKDAGNIKFTQMELKSREV